MVDDWRRTPGQGRYAHPERERRFRVAELPAHARDPRRIEDRYLEGTTLRLRRVTVGDEQVFKLTQKVRLDEHDPVEVRTTNTYLTADEHARLAVLPGRTARKTRWVCDEPAARWVVDVHDDGLLLAEVEVDSRDAALALPEWVGEEVTDDEHLTGAGRAQTDSPSR